MTAPATRGVPFPRYAAAMVTRIRKGARSRTFLREWRKHRGLDAVTIAGRLGIERESYYRWEREPNRINLGEISALADALGIEPEHLWPRCHSLRGPTGGQGYGYRHCSQIGRESLLKRTSGL